MTQLTASPGGPEGVPRILHFQAKAAGPREMSNHNPGGCWNHSLLGTRDAKTHTRETPPSLPSLTKPDVLIFLAVNFQSL